jgi:hypothetical protein
MIAGLFFVFILISGFWLSRIGRPYSTLILTIHKLIGLAAGGYLIITVYRGYQASPPSILVVITTGFTVLLFLGLIATGGLISAHKSIPGFISAVHSLFPYLTVLSTAVMLYVLYNR